MLYLIRLDKISRFIDSRHRILKLSVFQLLNSVGVSLESLIIKTKIYP